jgi:DNA polymerase III sliding clamp (beta) subunit (PCNA family)
MQIDLENISTFSDELLKFKDCVPKNPVNINESCILIEVEKDKIIFTCVETGSHLVKIVQVLNEKDRVATTGKVYVDYQSLLKRCQSFPNKKKGTIKLNNNNQLDITLENMGSSCINLFHNQEAFVGMIPEFEKEEILYEEDLNINLLPLKIASSSSEGQCYIKFSEEGYKVYGQLDNGAFFKIENDDSSFNSPYNFNVIASKLSYVNKIEGLNGSSLITTNSFPKAINFNCGGSQVIIYGNDIERGEYAAVDYIDKQESAGSIKVSKTEIIEALKWQLCDSNEGDSIKLSYIDDSLHIKTLKTKTPATIISQLEGKFEEVELRGSTLLSAINLLAKNSLVLIEQIYLQDGDDYVKMINISNANVDELSTRIKTYVSEQTTNY